MRVARLAVLVMMVGTTQAWAERQVKPFVAVALGGDTTYVEVEKAAGSANIVLGAGAVLLGEVLGLDVDFGYAPGFFEPGDEDLVVSSSVTTFSGAVVVALPRRWAEVGLRPYFVGGGRLMHVRINRTFCVCGGTCGMP